MHIRDFWFIAAVMVLAALAFFVPACRAQEPVPMRVGIVDSKKIADNFPAALAAEQELQREIEAREAELKKIADELKALQEEQEAKGDLWSEEKKKEVADRIYQLRLELKLESEKANREMTDKKREVLQDLTRQIVDAVEAYARREGYVLVLQRSDVVFYDESIDISDAIIAELTKQK